MSYEDDGDMDDRDMIHALDALNMMKIIETCSGCKSFTPQGCKHGYAPVYGYCHSKTPTTK